VLASGLLLASAFPAHAQVMVNRGINPWTGQSHWGVNTRRGWW
jgi:hypothetical protein